MGGKLLDTEVFVFIDKTISKNCYSNGMSCSKRLILVVLGIQKIEIEHGFVLHAIHMSFSRMQAKVTDRLSCGDHSWGVISEADMKKFISLHIDVMEKEPWVRN